MGILLNKENVELISGIRGGLVLGRSHLQGGIQIFNEYGQAIYPTGGLIRTRQCEMQGGEYVLNPFATTKHIKRINEINDSVKDKFLTPIFIKTSAKHIIDCRKIPNVLFYVETSGQFIINRQATINHLEELDFINDFGQDEIT